MFKENIYKFLLFLVLTTIFSFLIFITKNYFFWWLNDFENKYIEEKFISPTVYQLDFVDYDLSDSINLEEIEKKIEEKVISKLSSARNKIRYTFIPQSFINEKIAYDHFFPIDTFLNTNFINNKINNIDFLFYKYPWEVRWNIRNKRIRLYWIERLPTWETLSVWIHEFWHYIDLYFFENKNWNDVSNLFYDISWDSTTVIKPWHSQKDFVSGYSMTNKYEDFAESFTYYVLHNNDFLEKSKYSKILKQKYDFFSDNLFLDNEFKSDLYKTTQYIRDYYRDITKINFSLENFLQYLKK